MSISRGGSANWTGHSLHTRASATLTGLTSGDKLWLRVRAAGAAGPGPWSDPATKTVP